MKTHDPENVRIKRQYVDYLREAKRYSEPSIDKVEAALHRFESYSRFKPFRAFRIDQAKAFKQNLAKEVNANTGKPLGASTIYATLMALKHFFTWLAGQPGFRSKLSYGDADYFNPSGATSRIARAERPRPVPTLEQIKHVLRTMPTQTDFEKRNRALIACAILTGARDGALASLKLKHIDLEGRYIFQDASEVRTKNSKTFTTWFFPVGRDIDQIVVDWVRYLREEKLWGLDDPLFPPTRIQLGSSHHYEAAGLDRKSWSSAGPIREIFRSAFGAAGLPYFNPHSFRNALALLGEKQARTFEEMKAWSQNLGHERVSTTLSSYGRVAPERQAELMRDMLSSRSNRVQNMG